LLDLAKAAVSVTGCRPSGPLSSPDMHSTYVALLRGINVGGKNRILMADLVACFADAGYADVRTFIQSGNVVFRADRDGCAELTGAIEDMLADAFGYSATIALRDREEMRALVAAAPPGFGGEPHHYRYDVFFLMPPLTPDEALGALPITDGVDAAWAGPGVVYHSRLTARASQSRLSRLVSHPVYQRITIRNWNTTTKLLSMMNED
jgi:uncharacterized protein (DUF1697 family)